MKHLTRILAIIIILTTLVTLSACGQKCDHEVRTNIIYDVNLYAYRPSNKDSVKTLCFFTYKDADGYARTTSVDFNEEDVIVGTMNVYEACKCGKVRTITLTSETLHDLDVYTEAE